MDNNTRHKLRYIVTEKKPEWDTDTKGITLSDLVWTHNTHSASSQNHYMPTNQTKLPSTKTKVIFKPKKYAKSQTLGTHSNSTLHIQDLKVGLLSLRSPFDGPSPVIISWL